MVTYDILILIAIAFLIIGIIVGLWWASWILEEIIEKNKPKKPTPHIVEVDKIQIGRVGWCKGTKIYYCPNCKGLLSREYDYCHKCGQALKRGSDNNAKSNL